MAASYICDLCGRPIDEDEEVGRLHLRGINSNVPKRGKRGYNKDHHLAQTLELCSVCTTATWRAIEALVDPEQNSETYL
jgi:hypothetical protein